MPARPPDECEIGPDREQPEQAAQDLFPFGDPNNRLDMERMDREEQRHECASPPRSGQPPQNQEQEYRVDRVKKDVSEMMPAAVQSVKTDAQHVGEPRQRKPVGRVARPEGPRDGYWTQAIPDIEVVDDEFRVVVTGELKAPDLDIDGENRRQERKRDPEIYPSRLGWLFGRDLASVDGTGQSLW